MKKSSFRDPYKKDKGKISTTFRNTYEKSGVYIIRSKKTKNILYVGGSSNNLYRTMYRHFQSWEDKQKRATYGKFSTQVKVILATPIEAHSLEIRLTKELKPKDIDYKYKQVELDFKDKKVQEKYKQAENIPF